MDTGVGSLRDRVLQHGDLVHAARTGLGMEWYGRSSSLPTGSWSLALMYHRDILFYSLLIGSFHVDIPLYTRITGPAVQGCGCRGTGARLYGRAGGHAAAGDGGGGGRAYGGGGDGARARPKMHVSRDGRRGSGHHPPVGNGCARGAPSVGASDRWPAVEMALAFLSSSSVCAIVSVGSDLSCLDDGSATYLTSQFSLHMAA